MFNIKDRLAKLEMQFSEKEKELEAKKAEEETKKKSEEEEEEERKEKKFKERFDKHFSEGNKGIHEKMCNFEETIKSHGEAINKLLEMSETLLKKGDK